MRTLRSFVLRGLAALQLVLLPAVQLADGTGVHRCPEHDAGLGPTTESAATPHGSHGHKAAHHACTCLGACSGSGLAFAPTGPVTLGVLAQPAHRPVAERPVAPLRTAVRLLPFALGPPAHA